MHKRTWLFGSICFSLLATSTFSNKCLAGGSGYYEVPEGRPISAFSLCCCKKENENGNEQQTFYSCKPIDERECPENTKQYNVSISQCPSSLMFTKYENKNK